MKHILLSLLLLGCASQRPNRACILAENALKQSHKEGSCESVSLGETTDHAILRFDGGERMCKDAIGAQGGPLICTLMQPTNEELVANAKATAEADARAKLDAEAKARTDAGVVPDPKGAKKP
jgi:hypothetical protein